MTSWRRKDAQPDYVAGDGKHGSMKSGKRRVRSGDMRGVKTGYETGNGRKPMWLPAQPGCWSVAPCWRTRY